MIKSKRGYKPQSRNTRVQKLKQGKQDITKPKQKQMQRKESVISFHNFEMTR